MTDDARSELQFHPRLPDDIVFVAVTPDDVVDATLRPVEAAHLGPRAVAKRRREFERGRAAARLALDELGMGEPAIPVGEHREPLWPPDVVGSITHAAGYALAAVALRKRCGGIGLDLEADRAFPELGSQVAYGAEIDWLSQLAVPRRHAAALELFSAKETIYKAFFPRVGHFFGFAAVELTAVAGGFTAHFTETLDDAYPPDRWFRVDCSWHGDLVLSSLALPPDE